MSNQKKIKIELSSKDEKWVMAALRKKKAEAKFFNDAWKRSEELMENWKEREKIAELKAKQKAEKEAKEKAEEKKKMGEQKDELQPSVSNVVEKGKE